MRARRLAPIAGGAALLLFAALWMASAAPYPAEGNARAKELVRIATRVAAAQPGFSENDRALLADLRATGADDVDLFHGSHVVLSDAGAAWERWRVDARERHSSHYAGVASAQYERALPGLGPVLFGRTAEGDTWFQMEGHPDGHWMHYADWVQHKARGNVNVGPMGLSPLTEKRGTALRYNSSFAPNPNGK